MKRLPIGIQSFVKLREAENDFVYVDKTASIYDLVTASGGYYFLSRPRRFGKSVLLSTLDALFSGRRELFRGLYIEDKWDWERKYPVIRISFGGGDFSSEESFDELLWALLADNRERLGIAGGRQESPAVSFRTLIRDASRQAGARCVILIDEYDKPILDHITDRERARVNRDRLKSFYGIIKELDEHIRFVLITGVSKFSKMNLFSGLNNLADITINARYATLCGYTHAEVVRHFAEHLEGVDLELLRTWYNGYNYFGEPVYNPFDILLFLANGKEYRPYWWSTGNPSFLIDLLKEQPRYLPDLENCLVDDFILDTFDIDHIDLVALLWQTGYLTFAEKLTRRGRILYRLKVPNREVQFSLNELFIDYFTSRNSGRMAWQDRLYEALSSGDPESLRRHLSALFAAIPYDNYANNIIQRYEGYYASVVYAYLASLGFELIPEETSNRGRVDLTLILPDKIYIIEFKVDQPGRALAQLREKGYHEKYHDHDKTIFLVGIGFDSDKRTLDEFEWARL